ncbi:IS6 family transposase [Halonotius aquaticus]|uniref:IS6 family transposase n=1 Tax=Halonotius aquaticus TaxID=2216978 RepID=A0A3A6Q325_9EURY|nr:IS6 family transposase [Halonotius aquaticus]RJX43612.1 IS6 family transposase [Halonotius aquaticus]
MLENGRLSGSINQIELGFVEREATPEFLMKLSIQLYLSGLSLSNTVRVCEIFGVQRARSTVHNWVHKADLQPEAGKNPDHVAVDETVIQLNDEKYWLYAAVDAETNELLHTALESTRNTMIAQQFLTEIGEKHDVSEAVFLIDGAQSLQAACHRGGYDFRYEKHGNRNAIERVFREIKRRTVCFSNCFSNASAETADDWIRSLSFAWNQLI